MSVSPSARLSDLGETRFSPFFCADSPMYEHLSYKYFVGQSIGQATNGKNAKLLKKYIFSAAIDDKTLIFL